MSKNKTVKVEGFWWSPQEPQFPKPVGVTEPFPDKDIVVTALEKLHEEIILHKKGQCVYFKGFSTCRCCKGANGSREMSYKHWKWPEGLLHYVKVHNIRPSEEFVQNVLNIKPEEVK